MDLYLQAQPRRRERIVLDLDATDDPVHGEQRAGSFMVTTSCYCYLPLYIFCGEHLLCARAAAHRTSTPAPGRWKKSQRIVSKTALQLGPTVENHDARRQRVSAAMR